MGYETRIRRAVDALGPALAVATVGGYLLTEQFDSRDLDAERGAGTDESDESDDRAGSDDPDRVDETVDETDVSESGGHVLLDAERTVIRGNPAAERLLAPRNVKAGAALSSVFPEAAALVSRSTQGHEDLVVETDAGERTLETQYVPLSGTGGSAAGVLTFQDRSADRRSVERYRELVENASDLCLIVDADATITFAGQSLQTVLGYEPAAVVGKSVFEEVHPDDREHLEACFDELVEDPEETRRFEYRIQDADGDWHILEGIARNAFENPAIDGIVVNSRDVTERKRRERELERRNDHLEEFAEVVSHDIRNPLQVAKGHLEQAQETGEVVAFEHAKAAHDRIESLIEDVLALARQGETVREPESIDLESVALEAWRTVDTKSMTLAVEGDCTFEGDRNRVRQLFENLFRNAVEHAGHDVTVTVGPIEPFHTNTRIDRQTRTGFFVADDGPGIPAEEREDVFDSGYTTAMDGTGFGLAIAAKIADAHLWEATVKNSREGGARFEFTEDPGDASLRPR